MKLNLKNFQGITDTGIKYQIVGAETKFHDNVKEFLLHIIVNSIDPKYNEKEFSFDMHLSVMVWYKEKDNYKKALRDGFLRLEEKLGVQLLKSEMKIAV